MALRKNARTSAPVRKSADTGKSSTVLTSERIDRDLEAFRKAGGRIEVLGNTPVLTRVAAAQTQDAQKKTA